MAREFVFRSWPVDKTQRLKELWWQGKSASQIAALLGCKSGRVVREKAEREGFVRDPHLYASHKALPAQAREDGSLVTIENVRARECRWIIGPASADAVMCGRPITAGTLCAYHNVDAHTKDGRGKC